MSNRIYDSHQLDQITEFYSAFCEAFASLDPNDSSNWDKPLYIDKVEIVIRHRDDYAIARIGMDDNFPFVEFCEEDYGKSIAPVIVESGEDLADALAKRDDSVAAVVAAHLEAHIRQEDTASGAPRKDVCMHGRSKCELTPSCIRITGGL